MVLNKGEKVHVMVRRTFDSDLRRHFIGEITEAENRLIRVTGYAFIFDMTTNQYQRRPDKRTRIFDPGNSGNIVNVLPSNADIEQALYKINSEKRLVITDDKTFDLEINEFSVMR